MKRITVTFDGVDVPIDMDRQVKKEDLYGRQRRVVQDSEGVELERAQLTPEGELVRAQELATVTVDAQGSLLASPIYLRDGEPLEPQASSFKERRPITSVPFENLLEFSVRSVYPVTLAEAAVLNSGLYATTFNYRDSVDPEDALLLIQQDRPSFLLVGTRHEFPFVGKGASYNLFDAEDEVEQEDAADFDFGELF